ncbi:hypothetical protein F4054_16425 [Candidatus Poribacteria bacterium]|nr:hypothetical protein [Candidatus Poribacteria bacterium]MYK23827.1 hypothetical protein [Candidatus Poribacteria bacterium]
MGLGTGLFLAGIACVLLLWYLYRRSKNDTSQDTARQPDEADTVNVDDDYEDLLLTGLLLDEVYNDDDDSSDDMDTDGYDGMDDGAGFDDSGFE